VYVEQFFIHARTDRFALKKGYLTRRKRCRPHADDPLPSNLSRGRNLSPPLSQQPSRDEQTGALENNKKKKRIRETQERKRERKKEDGGEREMPRRCPRSRGAQNGGERDGAKRKPWKGIIALRALVSPASCNRDRFPSGSRLLARQFSLARFSLPRNRRETNDPIKWPARLSPSLSLFSRPLAQRARDCRLDLRASL